MLNDLFVESWEGANCTELDEPDIFFSVKTDDIKFAQALCSDCPLVQKCIQYALDNEIAEGIWGGLTEAQRKMLRPKKTSRKGIPNKQYAS